MRKGFILGVQVHMHGDPETESDEEGSPTMPDSADPDSEA